MLAVATATAHGGGRPVATRSALAPTPAPEPPPLPAVPVTRLAAYAEPPTPVVPPPRPRHSQAGVASWFHFTRGTCASRTIARGTLVTVTRRATGATATCRVADWGPGDTTRLIDLSDDVFAALADRTTGLIDVRISW